MGITTNCVKFLCFAKTRNVNFNKTLMLGRQRLFTTSKEMEEQFDHFKLSKANYQEDIYAENLFRLLDADIIDSLDFSDYEGATIIHDLNTPIKQNLKSKYSVIFDGGTLEHVFNFPQAIKNCMQMLEVGGTFLSITPTNNQCGHGFYQFSPELFFSLFNESSGFKLKLVLLRTENPRKKKADWYSVQDPGVARKRVTLTNSFPTYLLVMAEKITEIDSMVINPFQSDYETAWRNSKSDLSQIKIESIFQKIYRKVMPMFVRDKIYQIVNRGSESFIGGIGLVDPNLIKRFDI